MNRSWTRRQLWKRSARRVRRSRRQFTSRASGPFCRPSLAQTRLTKVASLIQIIAFFFALVAVYPIIKEISRYRQILEDERKSRHYQAWQAINSAQGAGGSGGRIDALQDLNNDGVSLAGVDLSGAFLYGVQLPGAKLWAANLAGANLTMANLCSANIAGANLEGAILRGANLRGADLTVVKIIGLCPFDAGRFNLQEYADYLQECVGAGPFAIRKGAESQQMASESSQLIPEPGGASVFLFGETDFRDADLWGARLAGADLSGAINLTRDQLRLADPDLLGTRLPSYLRGVLPDSGK